MVLKTQARAEALLTFAHLGYAVATSTTKGFLPGYVTMQSIAPETQEKPGTVVTIYVEQASSTTTTTSTSTTTTSTTSTSTTTTSTTLP